MIRRIGSRCFTLTGTLLSPFELLPSWPLLLYPQHLAVPSASRAQVEYSSPASTSTAFLIPTTFTGTLLGLLEPSPNCPSVLSPQHHTRPLMSTAHACRYPLDTWATSFSFFTSTGMSFSL